MTWLCKPLHLPFLLDLNVRHLAVPSLIFYSEWIVSPNQLLLTVFRFENLLKSNLYSWCVRVWHVTETIYVLTVFLNSTLLFSANLNFCCGQSILLPSKNSVPFQHVLQPDNATKFIPRLPILAGFILSLTKFHWVGSIVVWISPLQLLTKDLIELSTWILYPVQNIHAIIPENRLFTTWSPKTLDNTWHKCNLNVAPSSSNQGVLCAFSSATLDLQAMKETDTDTSSYTFLSYMTAT